MVLEIGGGLGLWAYLLSLEDVNVISTDPFTFYNVYKNMILFYDVEKYNNANILMLIWPPAEGMEGSNMSYDSLKLFKGNKLIYIGEYMGGLTGSEKFIELLNKEWKLVQKIHIPKWYDFINESIFIYERK